MLLQLLLLRALMTADVQQSYSRSIGSLLFACEQSIYVGSR